MNMSKKHKKVYTTLNYVERFLILALMITECDLISSFGSLAGITIEITSSAVEIKICAITTAIKKLCLINN